MGNSPITVGLKTQKLNYKAGDYVNGTVYLSVNKEGQQAQAVVLRIIGKEHAVVHYTTSETRREGDTDHTYHQDHYDDSTYDFLRIEYPLHRFQTERLARGQFEFPFCIQLPQDLPSTMKCQKGGSHCSVEYRFTATLVQASSGIFTSNPSAEQKLSIFTVPPAGEDTTRSSLELPVQEVPVVSCCCHGKGTIMLQASFSKTTVQPQDSVEIQFRCRNQSTSRVQQVRVQLEQTTEWTANRGHSEVVKDVLDRRDMDAEQFPELQKGHRRARQVRGASHEQQPFQDSNWNRCSIRVPNIIRDSYNGKGVKVRHLVSIQLLTSGCCTTDPDATTLVRVYQSLPTPATANAVSVMNSVQVPPPSHKPSRRKEGESTFASDNTTGDFPLLPSAPPAYWDDGLPTSLSDVAPVMAEAHVLPLDWNAQTAELVQIPMVEAIVLDDSSWNVS